MAEAIFRDLVKKENLSDKITVDSSGIGDYHLGESPHSGTRKILDTAGVSYEGMKATQISKKDWSRYDYIIAMDNQNMDALRKLDQNNQHVMVAKLMDFVNESKGMDVPDPYFTGDFEYTYQLVSEGCKQLLHYIKGNTTKLKER